MNAPGFLQKRRKINDGGLYPAAHNGLVPGSSPGRPTNDFNGCADKEA
jgi:hypothetical protein